MYLQSKPELAHNHQFESRKRPSRPTTSPRILKQFGELFAPKAGTPSPHPATPMIRLPLHSRRIKFKGSRRYRVFVGEQALMAFYLQKIAPRTGEYSSELRHHKVNKLEYLTSISSYGM
ncbi:hypothetical protein JG687_00010291 [Phytophthora cactorum]|uniref:Uncharacterized protein n=1 Tax=Phytophthora cactorum TaxID=29920 RepID=A0A8T1U7P0_9STRA|nr:hypothetical protein JG687_00010291 [Phytophthora cactorum]